LLYGKSRLKGVWRVTTPTAAKDFPALGYHFARIVHETTGVPIGLIDNSWGGSMVETWVSRESLSQIPEALKLVKHYDELVANYDPKAEVARKMGNWKRHADKVMAAGGKEPPKPTAPKTYRYNQHFPGGCFNALIAPIQKFSIAGVLFYQGMNNSVGWQARPNMYMDTFPALIPDWRKAFGDPDLPFGVIQMTGFGIPDDEKDPEIAVLHKATGTREAQAKAHYQNKNTGLICTYDLGHIQMHSPFKRPIGERAARWALSDVYKVKGIKYALAKFESCKKDGKYMILNFAKGTYPSSQYGRRVAPRGFVIAGKDRHFYKATVEWRNGAYAASSEFVDDPVAVRYAWGVNPVGNFGNRTGPTPPFRTDDWPAWSDGPIKRGGPATKTEGVPTQQQAKEWAQERKAAQARKVLEQYEQRKKPKTNKKK
jgi:sialate O-acetylesterase